MLVLHRKRGQAIEVKTPDGTVVRFVFLGIDHSGCARLGIEAPRNFEVDREEIAARKRMEKAGVINERGDVDGNSVAFEALDTMRRSARKAGFEP